MNDPPQSSAAPTEQTPKSSRRRSKWFPSPPGGEGKAQPGERFAPLAVISPHLDDAVFGCGDLLMTHPGSIVITVMAGALAVYERPTPWDADAGFTTGEDVTAARRREDAAALAHLHARPVWLEFLDAQYGPSPEVEDVAEAIDQALQATGLPTVLFPLGLYHSDHALTHAATLTVMRRRPGLEWLAYEEANYRVIAGEVERRRGALESQVWKLTLEGSAPLEATEGKRRAVAEYRSQLRALTTGGRSGYADVFAQERYWRVRPIPTHEGVSRRNQTRVSAWWC